MNRRRTKEQFELGNTTKIRITTYQAIEKRLKECEDIRTADYIICDECHYFTADAKFNASTDLSLQWILNQNNSIKIFMSATPEGFHHLLSKHQSYANLNPETIQLPTDYGYIESLSFFRQDNDLSVMKEIARDVLDTDRKAIFFVESAHDAYNLYCSLPEELALLCISKRHKLYKYVHEDEIQEIIQNETFEKQILITTAVLDSGFTIKDEEIDTIVIDMLEPETIIQCLGRKRVMNVADKVKLFIRSRANKNINGIICKLQNQMNSALQALTDPVAYEVQNNRGIDTSGLIYDEYVRDDDEGFGLYTRQVNWTREANTQYRINLYKQILKTSGQRNISGYDRYIAGIFGFSEDDVSYIKPVDDDLNQYLESVVEQEFLTAKARKPLIDHIHATNSRRHVLRKIKSLNAVLEEDRLPYQIITYPRGQHHHIWKVIRRDIS